jgi:Lipocalin-like domain
MNRLAGLEQLVGAWELRSCTTIHPDGTRHHMYGSAPGGVIMYSPDGWMSCHMASGGDADPGAAMVTHSGYYGPVVMRPDDSVVEHHVRNSTTEWMLGTVQERHYRIEGDTLILSAMLGENRTEVVWSRDRAG